MVDLELGQHTQMKCLQIMAVRTHLMMINTVFGLFMGLVV
jgi:hypothetical protein